MWAITASCCIKVCKLWHAMSVYSSLYPDASEKHLSNISNICLMAVGWILLSIDLSKCWQYLYSCIVTQFFANQLWFELNPPSILRLAVRPFTCISHWLLAWMQNPAFALQYIYNYLCLNSSFSCPRKTYYSFMLDKCMFKINCTWSQALTNCWSLGFMLW